MMMMTMMIDDDDDDDDDRLKWDFSLRAVCNCIHFSIRAQEKTKPKRNQNKAIQQTSKSQEGIYKETDQHK